MRTITGLDELKQAEGEELGVSDWHEVSQKDIDAFADVTGDHQWIHVDPERAKDTPFGGTIAHGYYTLSLAPMLTDEVMKMDGFAFAVNYGLNKVRFPAPVLVDSKVRMRAKLAELEEIAGGALVLLLHAREQGRDQAGRLPRAGARRHRGDRVALVRHRGGAARRGLGDLADLGLGEQHDVAGDLRDRAAGKPEPGRELADPAALGVPGH